MNFRISSFGLVAIWMLFFLGAALGGAIGNTISVVLLGRNFNPVPDTVFSLMVSVLLASLGTAVVRFAFRRWMGSVTHGSPDTPTVR